MQPAQLEPRSGVVMSRALPPLLADERALLEDGAALLLTTVKCVLGPLKDRVGTAAGLLDDPRALLENVRG
ncbi:hypothetical protein NDU88_000386 [Pleurodeles waltl]|uniref:Uncharacterized protein n=1 Tax=Pleurodeles waltl TaxID=8319 RepID=A0AAV7VVY6_PLEWA|nr:hypothetical protein NDU88_000386 [Pleurodeles waltl]